jgi:hypothetical protein
MNIAATSRLRLVVLAGVLAVAAVGFAVTTLPRLQSGSDTLSPVAVPTQAATAATPFTRPHAASTRHSPVRAHAVAKPAASAAAKPAHAAAKATPPVAHKARLSSSLPAPLARALAHHRVVVVAVALAGSAVDAEALAEAHAGAILAGSGFVTVNAGTERAKAFATLLQNDLEAPAVLVVTRPGKLFVRLDGFADRDLVAQAAHNAGS